MSPESVFCENGSIRSYGLVREAAEIDAIVTEQSVLRAPWTFGLRACSPAATRNPEQRGL